MRDVGRRRGRVKIYRLTVVTDEGGGSDTVKELYWDTWAEIEQIKASRNAENFQDKLRQVYSVLIRWRGDKDLSDNMIVEFEGKSSAIHTIDNDRFGNKFIELIVSVG